jgi:serine/threonine protein phosphatase PrpC
MNLLIGAKTDLGKRSNNEDFYAVLDVKQSHLRADGVMIVADGMGGRNFGETASTAAVEAVAETLVDLLDAHRDDEIDVQDALDSALRKANAKVYELSREGEHSEGMGTTCVTAVIKDGQLYIGHAGDSRAYIIRNQKIEQVTDDHSYVAEQVRAGVITEESARKSRFRNVITRAVGIEPAITPDVARYPLSGIDAVLICTDGLTGPVRDPDIERILLAAPSAQIAADKLVAMAKNNGGSDNITAVVVRFSEGPIVPDAAMPEVEDQNDFLNPKKWRAPRTPRPAGQSVLVGLLLLFIASTIYLTSIAMDAGYEWQAAWPPLAKPLPPPVRLHDFQHLTYKAPETFYETAVRGGPLTYSDAENTVSAVTQAGDIVALAPDGKTNYKFPLETTASSEESGVAAKKPGAALKKPIELNVHFATDSQGNLYVADAAAKSIVKYKASGDKIGPIAKGHLTSPESIAVSADGTVYVVDGGHLMAIHPAAKAAH